MKRILVIFSILAAMTSCLDSSMINMSGTSLISFEYNDKLFYKDSIYFDTLGTQVGFAWDYLGFYHKVDDEPWEFKGGFVVSRLNIPDSGVIEGLNNNQFRLNSKETLSKTNKFAVFCQTESMPDKHMEFLYRSGGVKGTCTMNHVYVNNTVAVAEAVKEVFEPGNQLLLRATGYKNGKTSPTGEAEIKLAERLIGKDSIVSSWTRFDLSKLGEIDEVMLSLETIPADLNIPMAVCLDNMVVNISMVSE